MSLLLRDDDVTGDYVVRMTESTCACDIICCYVMTVPGIRFFCVCVCVRVIFPSHRFSPTGSASVSSGSIDVVIV